MNPIDLTVTRTIPAPAAEVFDLWMDPTKAGSPWYGTAQSKVDATVGGLFYFAVEQDGRKWPHYGRFLRIERPALAEFTWVSEATKGVETIVTVTFEARGEQTAVTLRHSGVPDEMGRQHQEGWTWMLLVLADRLAQKS